MEYITDALLDDLSAQAAQNARLRMNHNFHRSMDDPIHRMLNALEPGTYIPPHRHLRSAKAESFLVLRGELALFVFDEEGNVSECRVVSPDRGTYGAEIPAGTWHSMLALQPGTVIYEVKPGPYRPIAPEDVAAWAPSAADAQAVSLYLESLQAMVDSMACS